MSNSLRPFSSLFGLVQKVRNWAFERGHLKVDKFSTPVVSVGNLSVGGTGKTPFVLHLIDELSKSGFKVGLVSRGYGGTYKGVAEVDLDQSWKKFGDEPVMIKARFPEVPFYLCGERVRAVETLINNHKVDLILADDAFQHRYLSRDLDIVLLDATQPISEYKLLPQGRLREPFSSLDRAHWIVITKSNLLTEAELSLQADFLLKNIGSREKVLWADFEYATNKEELGEKDLHLLSGIGRPLAFQAAVESVSGRAVKAHWQFKDHHEYSHDELKRVFQQVPEESKVITTEKDFVRLKSFSEYLDRIVVFKVDMKLRGSVDEFWTQMHSLTR